MFGWLKNLRQHKEPLQLGLPRTLRFIRGRATAGSALTSRYDAAVSNDDNRRHWANADALSADAAANPDVRRTLRNRARYEIANNSYARGIVLTLANDVVGTDPRLQMLTSSDQVNRSVEREFDNWTRQVGLAEKLRTMRMARTQDGEAFAVLVNNPVLDYDVKLDLRLIEADQVTSPTLSLLDKDEVDGICLDAYDNPPPMYLQMAPQMAPRLAPVTSPEISGRSGSYHKLRRALMLSGT